MADRRMYISNIMNADSQEHFEEVVYENMATAVLRDLKSGLMTGSEEDYPHVVLDSLIPVEEQINSVLADLRIS